MTRDDGTADPDPELVTLREASAATGRSFATLQWWLATGLLTQCGLHPVSHHRLVDLREVRSYDRARKQRGRRHEYLKKTPKRAA
jgi:hypothetical protein